MIEKESLFIGQRLEVLNRKDLPFVNDNYQFGNWIEAELNTETRDAGVIVSGELDPDYPVIVVDLCEDNPGVIAVSCWRKTGKEGPVVASGTLETFTEFFVPA